MAERDSGLQPLAPLSVMRPVLPEEQQGDSQPDQARASWETLIKTYPDSDMARLAKQNLDRLARAKPPV